MQIAVVVLLVPAAAGMWRIVRGPTGADRALGMQTLSTAVVAILLVLAMVQEQPALWDVAMVLALLAAIVTAALVQRLRRGTAPAEKQP